MPLLLLSSTAKALLRIERINQRGLLTGACACVYVCFYHVKPVGPPMDIQHTLYPCRLFVLQRHPLVPASQPCLCGHKTKIRDGETTPHMPNVLGTKAIARHKPAEIATLILYYFLLSYKSALLDTVAASFAPRRLQRFPCPTENHMEECPTRPDPTRPDPTQPSVLTQSSLPNPTRPDPTQHGVIAQSSSKTFEC